ncbi:hypothetical protein FDP41_010798 [Naegleria fowleri]|uniref:Palmitoyl-protein thioesterase 1 n=1 Tax=Naegleria fowleri TaxID=5763 RepID=A0A6A5CC47_NAEFO|nr:uncharacterized protein FDP41_010798 [Naegleria fowleri]KAF0982819.1 hypothetical protein FDP41_010798 [Naegleria fowleri]
MAQAVSTTTTTAPSNPFPVVLWHGMGDSCCFPFSMGKIESAIRSQFNNSNIYIHSIRIGSNDAEDVENSYLMNVNKQVQIVCDTLKKDPNLQNGFNAIGFSQGSQFLRAYVQRCNQPKVHNLISIGGQHQGVYGLPKCIGVNHTLCEYTRELLDIGVYWEWIQNTLVQAEYWHDPWNEAEFIERCIFLPDINNYRAVKNETYKANLSSLNKFVMVKFLLDSFVQPIESEHFGFYKPGQDREVVKLRDSQLYQEDWLGLKKLDMAGRLDFLEVEGDHLRFTLEWFIENIVNPYLK